MAVKITDVVITPSDINPSWQGIKNNFSTWNDLSDLQSWDSVKHGGLSFPLEVTVGETIVVTVSAVDITWEVINNEFADWNDVKNNASNWKAILNY